MERYWKWLMHANARALFVLALIVLLLVLGWCGWVLRQPARQGTPPAAPAQPAAAPELSIGILAFLSNELDAAGLVLPVNPFRPTLEALAATPDGLAAALRNPRWHRGPASTNDDPFAAIRINRSLPTPGRTPSGATPAAPTSRIPVLTYRGFFQRPDGKIAALFSDSSTQSAAFHLPGDTVHGMALLAADATRVRVRLPGGEEHDLAIGEQVQLPAETQP